VCGQPLKRDLEEKNRRLRHEIDLFGFLVVETAETQLKKEEEEEE
jgi:hypothetical protein